MIILASIPIKEQLLFLVRIFGLHMEIASIPIKEQLLSKTDVYYVTISKSFNSYKGTIVIRFF